MWNLKPDERLRQWRQFRLDIGLEDLETALKSTSNLWSYAPYVSHYLHPQDISNWPDPWTLVYENYYCDIARALGMLYTLYLSDHWHRGIHDLEIRIMTEPTDVYNTLWVNSGKYILNLEYNTIVNTSSIRKDIKTDYIISVKELKLDQN